MYPPKNVEWSCYVADIKRFISLPHLSYAQGPVAMMKKYGGNPVQLPPYDPFDELTFELEVDAKSRFRQELRSLKALGFHNELQNIRMLIRTQSLVDTKRELSAMSKLRGVFIGDEVVRGL